MMKKKTYLCNISVRTLELQLVNTMGLGFTIGGTFGDRALATSTLDTYTVNDVARLQKMLMQINRNNI